jgi:uncharacterized membrane protein
MRTTLTLLGALALIVGCVFFLQGINVLPGSFMTGQRQWAIYGALLMIAGVVVLIRSRLR